MDTQEQSSSSSSSSSGGERAAAAAARSPTKNSPDSELPAWLPPCLGCSSDAAEAVDRPQEREEEGDVASGEVSCEEQVVLLGVLNNDAGEEEKEEEEKGRGSITLTTTTTRARLVLVVVVVVVRTLTNEGTARCVKARTAAGRQSPLLLRLQQQG